MLTNDAKYLWERAKVRDENEERVSELENEDHAELESVFCMEYVGDPILRYESDKSGRYLCKTINANREQAVLARESSTMDIHDNNHIDYEKAVKRFLDVHFRGLRYRGEDESCKLRGDWF